MKHSIPTLSHLLLITCILTACQANPDHAVEFSADGVSYRGISNDTGNVHAYLGIPFAQAPINELRWQPPQPFITSQKTLEATQFAASCMQGPHILNWYRGVVESFGGDPATFAQPEVSEDCLYLNLWKPSNAENLPVLVFIHGGSNKGGWSYEPNYLGEKLAAQGNIVITIPYRLGVFGFFSHPELPHSNFGLLDQLAALQWIQKNIQTLGGDPDKVTISGESSGANNSIHLISSPLSKNLFQRAIVQSGGWAWNERVTREQQLELGEQFATTLLPEATGSVIDQLREISAEDVLTTATEIYQDHFFDPVIDGQSLMESTRKSFTSKKIQAIDLIIGSNADEWLLYLDENESVSSWLEENTDPAQQAAILEVLDQSESPRQQLDQLNTAINYVCPSMLIAKAVSNNGGKVWMYYFTRVRENELAASMGAYHGAELPYIFNTHDQWLPTNKNDDLVTTTMMTYWNNFIKNGDPNSSNNALWKQYQAPDYLVQNINVESYSEKHVSERLCEILMPN